MIDRVLILDFGSQYTQLIARRVRETGVYSEILPVHGGRRHDPGVRAQGRDPFGRPGVDHRGGRAAAPAAVLELGVPVLDICYGEQTLCAQLGDRVEIGTHREFGRRPAPSSAATRRSDVNAAAKKLQRAKVSSSGSRTGRERRSGLAVVRARRALPHNLLRFVDLESRLLEMLDHPGG
jgi:GMP synthase-like glutamine amidotransferase